MKFSEVSPPLCSEMLVELDKIQFEHMTPVQAATIPLFLSHKDVCVDACTGSGKTLAFVLPIIQLLRASLSDGTITPPAKEANVTKLVSMIISPTRELAKQIADTAQTFVDAALPAKSVSLLCFVGGTQVQDDLKLLHDASGQCCIVVGTPGRTQDLLDRCVGSTVDTREFAILVLDEADTLLDMGFEKSLNVILNHLPKQRRTALFSATQTQEVKALARAGLRNPATVSVQVANNKQVTPATLSNYYAFVGHEHRLSALWHFIQSKAKDQKLIVFFSTCDAVDFFGRVLSTLTTQENLEAPIVSLHGKMPQKKRTTHYNEFASASNGVLVCTDVVARGIDLPDVDWIVQFDPPQDPNFFVHRVGRTARAGRSGSALSFLSSNEDAYINFLELRKVPCEEMTFPIDTLCDVLPDVKKWELEDRDLLEKGTKAFISFVRSYKEHQCQFIFRFKDLDLGAVARGFALLRLPKISELRNTTIDFTPATDVDFTQIKYKDKAREKDRQKKLVEFEKENEEKRKKKHEEKDKKRKREEEEKPRRREKKKGAHQQILDEWDELAEEERLFKKKKKGKMSKEDYENVLLGKAEDEEGEKKTAAEKRQERFKKKDAVQGKTQEQKKEDAKREMRIKQKKKAQLVKRKTQKEQWRARRPR